jgi:hypothetical protein
MAQEIKRLQEEEQAASLEKKVRAAALMAEVAAANAQQIQRKKQLAEQEKQEEACIAEYIRQKDAREQVCYGCQNQGVPPSGCINASSWWGKAPRKLNYTPV